MFLALPGLPKVPRPSPRARVSGGTPVAPQTGLNFPLNSTAGSDIRIVFNGANLLDRKNHTVIWEAQYIQQTGYYSGSWHAYNDGSYHSNDYEFGAGPYPCDGAFDANGNPTGGTGGSGTVHYAELGGLQGGGGSNNVDGIALPMNPAFLIVKDGRRLLQAKTCYTTGGVMRHRTYPDLVNAPSSYIERNVTEAGLPTPGSPAFYFGCSDWRTNIPSAGQNDETPGAIFRQLRLFSAALDISSVSDLVAEAQATSDAGVTSAGIASLWYSNINPSPSDVTDKSGAGHSPSWANANRPAAWP